MHIEREILYIRIYESNLLAWAEAVQISNGMQSKSKDTQFYV